MSGRVLYAFKMTAHLALLGISKHVYFSPSINHECNVYELFSGNFKLLQKILMPYFTSNFTSYTAQIETNLKFPYMYALCTHSIYF